MLGRQTLLNCAAFHGYGNGCDGGDTWDVFRYMTEFGLPDEGCLPYNATDHTKFVGEGGGPGREGRGGAPSRCAVPGVHPGRGGAGGWASGCSSGSMAHMH